MSRSDADREAQLKTLFGITQVDDAGQLFISPVIHDWSLVRERGVDTVVDLEGGLDVGVPTEPEEILYIYFHIEDDGLPGLVKMDGLAELGALLIRQGHKVLVHCGMGFNRSALIAGVILHKLGMSGAETVARLRERRPGALFNENFARYLETL